jgi:hypothetical protein
MDERARTTRRWAVAVLSLATVALLGYVVFLVAVVWVLASAWNDVFSIGGLSLDLLAVVRSVAPVLLVGWCTGLAACAALSRGEAMRPRTAGLAAGAVGTAAGAAVLALSNLA